ncbi:hypothetical protein [Actinomycetospora flava]|uniref:Helix-turn-helix domain-containing protein n=1 Tax=Actinomycetospora flava TaxID=3129232 RepID=A0ABU8MF44_9PSEU
MLVDQSAALRRLERLVDAELWRADHRARVLAIGRALVHAMAWDSGLIAGVTRAHLAAAAGCSPRTVSRVLVWAAEIELLVCVETGATAEFLGTDTNRAPSYVLTAPRGELLDPADVPLQRLVHAVGNPRDRRRTDLPGDGTGNPPAPAVEKEALGETRGLKRHQNHGPAPSWPLWDRPTTAADRQAATATLLERVGLGGRVVWWRAHAVLAVWWQHEGACIAGLLHALDHHPDRPDEPRGDALRAARDPLRVLGHRLSPWRGRVAELPGTLHAVDGHERRRRRPPEPQPVRTSGPIASPATRAAARAAVAAALAQRR